MPTTRSRPQTARVDPAPARVRATSQAFTLLELIVTMAILSALFGIGLGAFRSYSRPERTALHQIKDAMRSARLFARSEGVPASVVIRPDINQLQTTGFTTVGNWHFETRDGAGWPVDASHPDAELVSSSVLGSALALRGSAQLELRSLPGSFDSGAGFGVEVHLQPEAAGRPMTLLERPGSWRLWLDRDNQLVVSLFLVRLDLFGQDADPEAWESDAGKLGAEGNETAASPLAAEQLPVGEEFRHEVRAARLPANRMTQLSVVFDGRTLRVAVDGARIEADTLFATSRRLVTVPGAPLLTGELPNQYRGLLDELRVASLRQGSAQHLPADVILDGEEQVIHVDAFGHLDPAWHRTPVRCSFTGRDSARRTVVEFGLLGTVHSWEEDVLPVAPASEPGDGEAG